MKPHARLHMSLIVVAISAIFGLLLVFDHDIASIVALWYVPTVLTLVLLSTYWKHHP